MEQSKPVERNTHAHCHYIGKINPRGGTVSGCTQRPARTSSKNTQARIPTQENPGKTDASDTPAFLGPHRGGANCIRTATLQLRELNGN
jgi:hypothetical protein